MLRLSQKQTSVLAETHRLREPTLLRPPTLTLVTCQEKISDELVMMLYFTLARCKETTPGSSHYTSGIGAQKAPCTKPGSKRKKFKSLVMSRQVEAMRLN